MGRSVDEIRTELLRLYDQWFEAVPPDVDSEFLRNILSDDWVYTNYLGEVRGKAEYLEYIKPVPLSARPHPTDRDMKVRVFGDIVIVHGRYFAPGVGENGETLLFTGGWEASSGEWRCLFHHTTILRE